MAAYPPEGCSCDSEADGCKRPEVQVSLCWLQPCEHAHVHSKCDLQCGVQRRGAGWVAYPIGCMCCSPAASMFLHAHAACAWQTMTAAWYRKDAHYRVCTI